MMNTQQPKKKPPAVQNDSILESLRDLGSGVGKTVVKDVASKVAGDALRSLFGTIPKSGELKANQPIEFTAERATHAPVFRRPEMLRPPFVKREETHLKEQIEAVRQELKALSQSIKNLNLEVQKAIDDVPPQPGVYHLNFMQRLRSILAVLREEIEDSNSWLNLSSARKKKKGYWGMYKKHGTKFGLSSERTMATQAG
ncbi:MAG: DUF5660 domain-containing protein [bacterium]|nr:DUF5660 domain-containing protein [bacterium]